MAEADDRLPPADEPAERPHTTRSTVLLLVVSGTFFVFALIGKGVANGTETGAAVAMTLGYVGFLGTLTLAEWVVRRERSRLGSEETEG